MVQKIKEYENERRYKVDLLQKLEKQGIPILIYGNGLLADSIKDYLENEKSIHVSDYFVAESCKKNISDKTIYECKEKYGTFAVIIGVASPVIAKEKVNEFMKEKNIVEVIIWGDNYPTGFPFLDSKYIDRHITEILSVYNELEDDLSRESMLAFLKAKISGNSNYLDENKVVEKAGTEYFNSIFYPACIEHEVFVDGGAFRGDTYEYFVSTNLKAAKYYAFEPDLKNFEILKKKTAADEKVRVFSQPLSDKKVRVNFSQTGSVSSKIENQSENETMVETSTIDIAAPDATFIKLDIEGAELDALRGGEQTILANSPKLAICCYHRREDVFAIPLYIKSLNKDYKLFFRQHTSGWCRDLVLYAYVPK